MSDTQSSSSDTSAFVIRELSGDKREVKLQGRALPYKPFNLESSQRVEIAWLPGSAVGTSTVLGPKEGPTILNGYWKTKYLGDATTPLLLNGEAIVSASLARQLFDDILRKGQLVEVTWADEKRHGHLSEFKKNWYTTNDLEWSIGFAWIGRGEPTGPAVFILPTSPTQTSNTLKKGYDDLADTDLPSAPMNGAFLGGLTDIANLIGDAVFAIEDQVQQLTNTALAPFNAIRGIIATCSGLVDECTLMRDYLKGAVAGAIGHDSVEDQSASDRMDEERWRQELIGKAIALRATAIGQRSALQTQIYGDIAGQYIAREGDDLRDVSRQFYGTPAEWQRIMIFNGFTGAELEAGELVLVPKVNVSDLTEV